MPRFHAFSNNILGRFLRSKKDPGNILLHLTPNHCKWMKKQSLVINELDKINLEGSIDRALFAVGWTWIPEVTSKH